MAKPKRVIFRLKRFWTYPDGRTVDLYQEIKEGRKTFEYRDYKDYWTSQFYTKKIIDGKPYFTQKVDRAWFIVGFPKGNVPRLEADISGLSVLVDSEGQRDQYEVYFTNVKEVTE